jgi:hypothetical protein
MGMFDMVVVLDSLSALSCAEGHAIGSFHTKDLPDPAMSTYLVRGGRLYLAVEGEGEGELELGLGHEHPQAWRFEGDQAAYVRRHRLQEAPPPRTLRVYGCCEQCEPVLVRNESPQGWCDVVVEHALVADFRLTFRKDEPLQIERLSGTRQALEAELRSRGLLVLSAGDALAEAHREVKRVRQQAQHTAKKAAFG